MGRPILAKGNDMKVKTESGFKFELDERILSDYRIIEALKMGDNSADANEMIEGTVDLVNLIFGADKPALMEHIKKLNDGFVPIEAMRQELNDVFEGVKELKNSESSRG